MKSIVLPSLLFSLSVAAQTGDISLKESPGRLYQKIAPDPKLKGNGFKRWLIGENYRKEWTDSVRVPAINFDNDFGGLTPQKEGGGKQTHSLDLKDGEGRDWVLRSVQKFPDKVIAPELKGTIAQTLVKDGITGSYPYSVLSVGTLAKAAGIPFFPNTVVYIPDDPKLGQFRETYKNTLSLFELRTITEDKNSKLFDTEEVVLELQESAGKAADQSAVLRARLLDNFIMDFDRHEGQWSWLEKKSGEQTLYVPVPKDRDQAFFYADGLLARKLSKKPPLGPIQGLRAKPKNILSFNYAARNFDRRFLNELDEQKWSDEIDRFLAAMTDEVIGEAINKQPQEVRGYHADKIAATLKSKREFFKNDMLRYYRFLSKTVSIVGSNKAEKVFIRANADGTVKVEMQDENAATTYSRLFHPSVTEEIQVYGLEARDSFLVDGESSAIKLRLIGGPGDDVFINKSNGGRAIVYDVSVEDNSVSGSRFRNKISPNPLNNEYRRLGAEYNASAFGIVPELSREGGLFLGPSFTVTTHGFRKEPYASKHFMYVTKALTSSAWHLHYDADFISIGNKTDLLFRSDARLPTVRTHFFGYGNNTVFDRNQEAKYYQLQYTLLNASLMLRHPLSQTFHLSYGPLLQHFDFHSMEDEDKYINTVRQTPDLYNGKWYTGGEVRATVNTRNNEIIPTRGIHFNTYARGWLGLSSETNKYSQVGGDLSMYSDFLFKKHVVLATSFGAHRNFDRFKIPQAQYLGLRQNLRGYRFQRFAGKARAYNNSELRVNFGDLNLYLLKGAFGVLGFHDVGKVWVSWETSDTWHRSYGGGIWLAPFNKTVITALLTASKEEKALPMVTFGFQF